VVRYFYACTPLVIVGTAVLVSLPWLGLIALMMASLVALAALALVIVFMPYMLSQAISRRWHNRTSASPRTAPAESPAGSSTRPTRSAPTAATVLFTHMPPERTTT
jgi:hypothetical protein